MGATRKGVRLATYSEALNLNPHGRKKLRCPHCGALSFVPYVYEESGQPVGLEECGRCDHQESCGYHLPPAEYFKQYPERRPGNGMSKEEREAEREKRRKELQYERQLLARQELIRLFSEKGGNGEGEEASEKAENGPKSANSRISWDIVAKTEKAAENTVFFKFLCKHFGADTVRRVFRSYHIGGDSRGRVIFWQIDNAGEVRTGKVMNYGENGHRVKAADGTPAPGAMNWAHAIMKKHRQLPEGWQLEQCLFGAHLLSADDLPAPVCLVEAEKTAIIAACAFPSFVWVATGGKYNLKADILAPLLDFGAFTVFADLGSREEWEQKLTPLRPWAKYSFSDIVEKRATPEALARGLDLADLITGEF